jgi:hypothetical protein
LIAHPFAEGRVGLGDIPSVRRPENTGSAGPHTPMGIHSWREMTMSHYERVLRILDDGDWHEENELRTLVSFPQDWIRELRLEGKEIDQVEQEGRHWLRLTAA